MFKKKINQDGQTDIPIQKLMQVYNLSYILTLKCFLFRIATCFH